MTSFSEAITLKTRQGKAMSNSEAIGYLRELIGMLEQKKLRVSTLDDATERWRMLSALSMKIYALHLAIYSLEKQSK
jgi:hypothetical protein